MKDKREWREGIVLHVLEDVSELLLGAEEVGVGLGEVRLLGLDEIVGDARAGLGDAVDGHRAGLGLGKAKDEGTNLEGGKDRNRKCEGGVQGSSAGRTGEPPSRRSRR